MALPSRLIRGLTIEEEKTYAEGCFTVQGIFPGGHKKPGRLEHLQSKLVVVVVVGGGEGSYGALPRNLLINFSMIY